MNWNKNKIKNNIARNSYYSVLSAWLVLRQQGWCCCQLDAVNATRCLGFQDVCLIPIPILLTLSMKTGQSSCQAVFLYNTSNRFSQFRLSYHASVPSLQQENLPPLLQLGSLGTELAQKQRETCIWTEPKEPAVMVRTHQPKSTEEATTWDSGKGK